jgi:hypothetical protein
MKENAPEVDTAENPEDVRFHFDPKCLLDNMLLGYTMHYMHGWGCL